MQTFLGGEDCPVFNNMYQYCQVILCVILQPKCLAQNHSQHVLMFSSSALHCPHSSVPSVGGLKAMHQSTHDTDICVLLMYCYAMERRM